MDDQTDGGTGGLLGLLSQLKSFRRVLNVYIQIFCGPIILIPAVRIKMANLTYTKFPIALFFRQHAASIYGFVCFVRLSKKICVSVCWVTLWVRPPSCENMCVRSLG